MLVTPTLSAKRLDCGLTATRPFAVEAMGSRITWPNADGHIVRPRGFGGPPG